MDKFIKVIGQIMLDMAKVNLNLKMDKFTKVIGKITMLMGLEK